MVEADEDAEVEGKATIGCLAKNVKDDVGNCWCRLLCFVGDTVVPEEKRPVERKAVTNVCDNENANTTESNAIRSIDFVVGKNIIIVCWNFFFLIFFFVSSFLLLLL